MPYDVIEERGVVKLAESEKGKHKTAEAAAAAAEKVVAANIKAELAAQDKDDKEAEAASSAGVDTYLQDMRTLTPEQVADKHPKQRSVDEAKARGLPYSGNEQAIMARVLADMKTKNEL